MTASHRPRVLLIAEAANPRLTSVALIGWSVAQALLATCDVHLVSELRNRDDILAAGFPAERFTAIDNRTAQGGAWRLATWLRGGTSLGWSIYTALASLTYPWFERSVWRAFGPRLRAGEFDIVHRITPLSLTAPSLLAARCRRIGVPFIVGPLNGYLAWPPHFPALARREKDRLTFLRPASRLLPGLSATWASATLMLAGSRSARAHLPISCRNRILTLPENAVDERRFPPVPIPARAPGEPLRLVFIGRLVAYKGLDLAITAAADLLRTGRATLTVLGDGPERSAWEQLAQRLNVADQVIFRGNLPHEAVHGELVRSHVLAFPSLREFGGGVVPEALVCGVVPVVVDYGGPPELTPGNTGMRIPLAPREELIAHIAEAFRQLEADDALRRTMAAAGMRHGRTHLTWTVRARQLERIYRRLAPRWAMSSS